MIDRRFILEATALVAMAVACALVANLIAARERRVALVGNYPSALKVPARSTPATGAALTAPAEAPGATPLPSPPGTAPGAGPAGTAMPAAAVAARFPAHPEVAWKEIGSGDALALHQAGAPFADARRSDAYAEGHIPGAFTLSVWEADLEAKLDAFLGSGVGPEQPIVVYCAGGNCEDSHMLSENLFGRGFSNALVYKDGFPDWESKGRAVVKGTERGTR